MRSIIRRFIIVGVFAALGASQTARADFTADNTGVPVLVEPDPIPPPPPPAPCTEDSQCKLGEQCNVATGECFVPLSKSDCACSDGDACTKDITYKSGAGSCYCTYEKIDGCYTFTDVPGYAPIPYEDPLTPKPGDITTPPSDPTTPPDPETPADPTPEPTPTPTADPVPESPESPETPASDDATPATENEPLSSDCSDGVVVLGDCKAKDFVHIQGGGDGCALVQTGAPTGTSLHGWLLAIAALFLGGIRSGRSHHKTGKKERIV